MNTRPKNPPQTEAEMTDEMAKIKKGQRRFYKTESDEHKSQKLSELIVKNSAALAEADKHGKIPLYNTEAVKRQTFTYLKSCEQASVFPSMVGLSRSLGYSRNAIYGEIEHRVNPATSDWLEMCRDTFSDILAQSALENNANFTMAIFLSKAVYGLRESVELVVTPSNPLGESKDPTQIKRLVDALPEADYELPKNE